MRADDAVRAIADRVTVTRADIVNAKAYLLGLGSGLISVLPQCDAWAALASPGTPKMLGLDDSDIDDQCARVARYITARLACGVAAWELVRTGLFMAVGQSMSRDLVWDWQWGGQRGGLNWAGRLVLVYPDHIHRPEWLGAPSELFDADIFLQRLKPLALHPGIERALRLSLDCFQRELWVPCVAMLGAASEGAWIEMGLALSAHFSGDSLAGKLGGTLRNPNASTKAKISAVCHYYERPTCTALRSAAEIDDKRLRQIEQWSDQVRESRNVLHWGATPSVPNTYEKVAVLLMDAVSELNDLHRIRDAC